MPALTEDGCVALYALVVDMHPWSMTQAMPLPPRTLTAPTFWQSQSHKDCNTFTNITTPVAVSSLVIDRGLCNVRCCLIVMAAVPTPFPLLLKRTLPSSPPCIMPMFMPSAKSILRIARLSCTGLTQHACMHITCLEHPCWLLPAVHHPPPSSSSLAHT